MASMVCTFFSRASFMAIGVGRNGTGMLFRVCVLECGVLPSGPYPGLSVTQQLERGESCRHLVDLSHSKQQE